MKTARDSERPSSAVRLALGLYLCSLPLAGLYLVGEWLRLYVVGALVLLAGVWSVVLFRRELPLAAYQFLPEDVLLAMLILAMGIAGLVNTSPKSVNYLLGYGFVFLCLYLLVKLAVAMSHVSLRDVYALLGGVAVAAAAGGISEFTLRLTTGIDLLAYIPLPQKASEAAYAGLPRAAFTMNEPGHFAMFLQAVGPIGVYGIWLKTRHRLLTATAAAVVVAGWVVAFSAGGVVATAISSFAVLLAAIYRRNRRIAVRVTLALVFVTIGLVLMEVAYGDYIWPLVRKIQAAGGARPVRWTKGLQVVMDHPLIGTGPGSTSSSGSPSYWSWYLTLAAEIGAGGALAPLFLAIKSGRAATLDRKEWPLLLFGIVATTMHLVVVSMFMYGFIWILVALIDVASTRTRLVPSQRFQASHS